MDKSDPVNRPEIAFQHPAMRYRAGDYCNTVRAPLKGLEYVTRIYPAAARHRFDEHAFHE
jgi:hypothetical protein